MIRLKIQGICFGRHIFDSSEEVFCAAKLYQANRPELIMSPLRERKAAMLIISQHYFLLYPLMLEYIVTNHE